MLDSVVIFIILLALGYLIFVYAGKQAGLNKILGFVVVGVITITLISIPIITCLRYFDKRFGQNHDGFQPLPLGPEAFYSHWENPQIVAPIMPNMDFPGLKGDVDIEVDTYKGEPVEIDPQESASVLKNIIPKEHLEIAKNFTEKDEIAGDISDTARWLQKDPKLVEDLVKALKDKPEALKALKDKLK